MNLAWVFLMLVLVLVLPVGAILGIIAFVRVLRLERDLRGSARPAEPKAPVASHAPPLPQPHPAPSTPTLKAAPSPKVDIETVIGSAWLNRIGIVVLLFAAAFFLKFAFDNNWIGPIGRVVIGLLAGSASLVWSEWLYSRRYKYFSEGIAALAVGIIYLSLYAGFVFYHFLTPTIAFAGMAATTATAIALALGRDSERLAFLALLAGFITPLLINTGVDAMIPLFSYLAVLNAGLLAVGYARDWRSLPIAFLFTVVYAAAWWDQYFEPTKLAPTLLFASIFFCEFSVLPLVRARHDGAMRWDHVVITLLNAGWYAVALNLMFSAAADANGGWRLDLNETHRWLLTLAILLLGGAHLIAANIVQARTDERPSLARVLYAGIALALVTVAIPIRLHGEWVIIGWSIEGAALVWAGFTARTGLLRAAGLLLLLVVACYLCFDTPPGGALFFNTRFGAFAAFVASLWAAVWLASRQASPDRGERTLFSFVEVLANLYGVVALTLEAWDWGQKLGAFAGMETPASQLSVSVVWAGYATILMVLGVWRNAALLRWQALVLFGLVIVKIFLIDLASLALGYRIASFFVVGVLLLGVSFLYQRRRAAGGEKI